MDQIENSLFRAINSMSGEVPAIDFLMIGLSASNTWMIIGAATLLIAYRTKNVVLLSLVISALIALGLADLISFEVVKPIVARERPCWVLGHVTLIGGKCGGSYGFTSNHAANAFAVWMVFARGFGLHSWQSLVILTVATLVGLSRVYLGVHYFGDILGGAILGSLVAWSSMALGLRALSDKLAAIILPRDYSER